jgi:hypothetical protein
MPDRDPRRELETCPPCDFCGVEGCPLAFTGHGYACEGCWPDTAPQGVAVLEAGPIDGLRPDQVPTREQVQAHYDALDFECHVDDVRAAVASISDEQLATLPELERRLITETRAHLAEYDRAKRGEGGHG